MVLALGVAAGLGLAPAHGAGNPQGFSVQNEGVFALVHGLPRLGRTALPAPGTASMDAMLEWTNDYTSSVAGNEGIVIDVETRHLRLGGSINLGGWVLEATVPLLVHDEGVLDATIDSWHDLTGFPGGGRDTVPRDRFRVFYQRDGQALIDLDENDSTSGLGDIALGIARQYGQTVVRAEFKLPTGDAESLTGSGGSSGSISVDWAGMLGQRWSGFFGIAAVAIAGGDWLPGLQRNIAGTAMGGVGYALLPTLTAKLQFNAHSPLYEDSDLDQLRRTALQLSTGLSWAVSEHRTLDIALVENPVARVAPDVGLHINLRGAFGWR